MKYVLITLLASTMPIHTLALSKRADAQSLTRPWPGQMGYPDAPCFNIECGPYVDPRRFAPRGGMWPQYAPPRPWIGPQRYPYGVQGPYPYYGPPVELYGDPYRPYYTPRSLGGGRYRGGYPPGYWER